MGSSPCVSVFATGADARAARIVSVLGARPVADVRGLLRARGHVVVACVSGDRLREVALWATLGGAAAVIAAPSGSPGPLPWWGRRFHRFLFASQAEASGWGAAGVALGRLVVVPEGPEEAAGLRAVVEEVAAMAARRDTRARAR